MNKKWVFTGPQDQIVEEDENERGEECGVMGRQHEEVGGVVEKAKILWGDQ